MDQPVNIFWFRRDLRLDDNAGLYHALRQGIPVLPIFIFDTNILNKLENPADRRVSFIYQSLKNLQSDLQQSDSSLHVYYGSPGQVMAKLTEHHNIKAVFTNHDYEPYALERDEAIAGFLRQKGIEFHSFKDQVIFEKDEVLKDDGKPYTVFTPYSRRWKSMLNPFYLSPYPVRKYARNFHRMPPGSWPSLLQMGFEETDEDFPKSSLPESVLKHYGEKRDFPGIDGTSRLGVHLRFGTISIRKLAARAQASSETYLNELIWRDFYHMILWHFPQVGKGRAFHPAYEHIVWRNNESEFEAWCQGRTGYPIVDAGMRQLNETGYMHNRVRMIVASFLAKHLLIDWRWGESYFASHLLDFDLAANNGGWQWAAGCGCDAAPYFRIFNPYLQTKKFDSGLTYIKRWVPEYGELDYPRPIVDHEWARKRCLQVYKKALAGAGK